MLLSSLAARWVKPSSVSFRFELTSFLQTTPISLERGVFTVKFELNPTAQNFQPPGFVPPLSVAEVLQNSESAVAEASDEEDEVLLRDVSAAHLLASHQYQDDCE